MQLRLQLRLNLKLCRKNLVPTTGGSLPIIIDVPISMSQHFRSYLTHSIFKYYTTSVAGYVAIINRRPSTKVLYILCHLMWAVMLLSIPNLSLSVNYHSTSSCVRESRHQSKLILLYWVGKNG